MVLDRAKSEIDANWPLTKPNPFAIRLNKADTGAKARQLSEKEQT
jgi:hypothetical protein